MFDWIKKLLGAKGELSSVAQNAQELTQKATAAYKDVMADGKVDFNDITKIKDHATGMMSDVKEMVADVKEVAQIATKNEDTKPSSTTAA